MIYTVVVDLPHKTYAKYNAVAGTSIAKVTTEILKHYPDAVGITITVNEEATKQAKCQALWGAGTYA